METLLQINRNLNSRKGIFISFEGGEGVGKSTQIELLRKDLINSKFNVVSTREPGGTKEAEELRKFLVSGDKKCSLNKVKRILAEKDVCLADAEQVKEISGFTIGGVSPIGIKNNLEILIDAELKRFDYVFAAAGHPHAIFKISFNDLKNITSGKIMDISE